VVPGNTVMIKPLKPVGGWAQVQELSRPITSVVDLVLFNSHQSAFIYTYSAVFTVEKYPTWNLTRALWIVIPDQSEASHWQGI
jgi:hypothetical protein